MTRRSPAKPAALIPVILVAIALLNIATAAAAPFGVGVPEAVPAGGAWSGWLVAEGARFYQALSTALKTWKESGTAPWTLIGLSLGYGVFHAAGPGHGKAVISSYLFSSGDTLKWGLTLAFLSAMVQAVTAVLLVSVLAAAIGVTAAAMDRATVILEYASYAAIAGIGAWLVWQKGRTLWRIARRSGASQPHGASCQHGPVPLPFDAAKRRRAAVGAILSIGIRPCSGAIFILVFALSQGLFLAGVASAFAMAFGTALTVGAIACLAVGAKSLAVRLAAPGSHRGAIVLASLETLTAFLIFAIGILLLAGAVQLLS